MPELIDNCYPPKEPRIEKRSYLASVSAVRTLLQEPGDGIPIPQRRDAIGELLNVVPRLDVKDSEGQQEAARRMLRLLQTDPLSGQQAGAVARYIHHVTYKSNQPGLDSKQSLLSEEIREIEMGDWPQIDEILSRDAKREAAWSGFKGEMRQGKDQITIFRGMHLSGQEAELIIEHGIVPEGLRRYKTLESLLLANLLANLKGNDPTYGYLKYPEQRLLISKVNVLLRLWQMGDLGMTNPHKLAISATSPEHAEKKIGKFWGDHMLEIHLPSTQVILGPDTRNSLDVEDERSVLYYVAPEAIGGIYAHNDPHFQNLIKTRFQILKWRDRIPKSVRRFFR